MLAILKLPEIYCQKSTSGIFLSRSPSLLAVLAANQLKAENIWSGHSQSSRNKSSLSWQSPILHKSICCSAHRQAATEQTGQYQSSLPGRLIAYEDKISKKHTRVHWSCQQMNYLKYFWAAGWTHLLYIWQNCWLIYSHLCISITDCCKIDSDFEWSTIYL